MLATPAIEVRPRRTERGLTQAHSSTSNRVAALTGLRALAALMVVGTHAAAATGKLDDHFGLAYARLEIGVPIFFALSGFLLFGPWVKAAASGSAPPVLGRYAWRRLRRVLPPYVVAVLLVFIVYLYFSPGGANPGQTWLGLLRYLTLTQIYTDNYLYTYLHPGLSQMWSLAVEAAFYAALPLLAYGLLVKVCGRRWRPGLLLTGLAVLAAVSPMWLLVLHATDWLPNSAGMWLPAHLAYFVGGMTLAVLQVMGVRCRAWATVPLALIAYVIASTPITGWVSMNPVNVWQVLVKTALYAIVATLMLAPLALGGRGLYERILGSRPMLWLGGISYEIFLLHVVAMAIAMSVVLHWKLFTGSMAGLIVVTLVMTIPLAWLLHRSTTPDANRVKSSADRHQLVDRVPR